MKFEKCIPNKKIRKSMKQVQRRIERDQESSNFVKNKYLFPQVTRENREVLEEKNGNFCHLEKLKVGKKDLGYTLSQRILLPSKIEINNCVGKCDLIHTIDGNIEMTNQARMRLLR